MFYYIRKFDWIMIGAAIALSFLGLATLYSLSQGNTAYSFNLYKQGVFLAVAFGAMVVVGLFDYRILKQNSVLLLILYALCIVLLAGLLVFAPEIKGAKRWYSISFLTFDPFEITKIAVLLLLAKYFAFRHAEIYNWRHIIRSGMYVMVPALLVFFQPDFGSVVLLVGLWVLVMLIAGITKRQVAALSAVALVSLALLWVGFLKDYQKERVLTFLDPQRDPLGGGYSLLQAKIAVGSAGFWGKGWLEGPQVQYGFLPEPHTDFIFAAFTHEWGFAGAALLMALLFVLFWRIANVAIEARNNFSRFVASSTIFIFLLQGVVNIGMNVGVFPVIGVSLPFMSYGGSTLVSSFVLLGLLQSIRLRTPRLEAAGGREERG